MHMKHPRFVDAHRGSICRRDESDEGGRNVVGEGGGTSATRPGLFESEQGEESAPFRLQSAQSCGGVQGSQHGTGRG